MFIDNKFFVFLLILGIPFIFTQYATIFKEFTCSSNPCSSDYFNITQSTLYNAILITSNITSSDMNAKCKCNFYYRTGEIQSTFILNTTNIEKTYCFNNDYAVSTINGTSMVYSETNRFCYNFMDNKNFYGECTLYSQSFDGVFTFRVPGTPDYYKITFSP